jgi:hypothetical protein
MLVVHVFRAKKFLAMFSVLAVVAGLLLGARVAVADPVWVQSYQRASASQACVAKAGETPWQANWGTESSWQPSWEQWANGGKGGWTRTRSVTWARDSAARTYALGDIGPGGGLVFLFSGGLTYEMAPKTWGGNETTGIQWCSDTTNSVATGTAVGTGSANTTAMLTSASSFVACTSSAPNAVRANAGGGLTDWFLPSQDELNAMCYYSRNLSASPDPTVSCYGGSGTTQNTAFAGGSYGFASDYYWSSSEIGVYFAWSQEFDDGSQLADLKFYPVRVRPVRAF